MTQQSVSSRRLASRAARTLALASVLFATPFVVATSASAQVRSSALGYAPTQPGAFPADEVMNVFGFAIRNGLGAAALKDAIFAYPTHASDVHYML